MQNKQQESAVWTFVLIVSLAVLTLLSFAAIIAVMTSLSQIVLVAVLLLASSSAGASVAATLWLLERSSPWAGYRFKHRKKPTLSSAWKRIVCRLQAICRCIATWRSVRVQWGKWFLGIVFFGLIIVGLGIIVLAAHEPAIDPKPLRDLLVAVGVLLVGLPLSIAVRAAPTVVACMLGALALIAFMFPVLSDVIVCGVIVHDLRWFCATFDDFPQWRSGYMGIGFMFLGIALPPLLDLALRRVNPPDNPTSDHNSTDQ